MVPRPGRTRGGLLTPVNPQPRCSAHRADSRGVVAGSWSPPPLRFTTTNRGSTETRQRQSIGNDGSAGGLWEARKAPTWPPPAGRSCRRLDLAAQAQDSRPRQMDANTEITCPECGHEFAPMDRVWNVCLTCGEIWPPGDEWHSHNWNDDVDCDGVHSVRKYSEEAALEKQQEVRENDE